MRKEENKSQSDCIGKEVFKSENDEKPKQTLWVADLGKQMKLDLEGITSEIK